MDTHKAGWLRSEAVSRLLMEHSPSVLYNHTTLKRAPRTTVLCSDFYQLTLFYKKNICSCETQQLERRLRLFQSVVL